VLQEDDALDEQSDVQLPQDLHLALVGVDDFGPVVCAADFVEEMVDVVPDEVEEVHAELLLRLRLVLSTRLHQLVLVPTFVQLDAAHRVHLLLLEDLEGDGEFEGQAGVDFDDEEHGGDCADHAAHKGEDG